MSEPSPEQLKALRKHSLFTVKIVPTDLWWSLLTTQDVALPWHRSVLLPLLHAAKEACAYELPEGSAASVSAGALVRKWKGKYAIDLTGNAIDGHEYFWNASGGRRGSVVILIPRESFPAESVFPHCCRAMVTGNPAVAHTPSAYRYAAARVAADDMVACVFSRNNGFEYFDLMAPADLVVPLFMLARRLIPDAANV